MRRFALATLLLVPLVHALWVWLSPLAFVPVPWPDDSAFYLAGKDLWAWPPRWVMIAQAPFEPTYRLFNFNTMPLFPVLLGLGRLLGITSPHAIKVYPLAGASLAVAALAWGLYRQARLPLAWTAGLLLPLTLDPIFRWSSVLVRPESFIAALGVLLVFWLAYGPPEKLRARGLWHPIAFLLALGAYAHFNAIHLVWVVVAACLFERDGLKRLLRIGWLTFVYLSPWVVTALLHLPLFLTQFRTQWERLVFPNDWLHSAQAFEKALWPAMGSPEPWSEWLRLTHPVFVASLLLALAVGLAAPLALLGNVAVREKAFNPQGVQKPLRALVPAGAWVASSAWLWHTKPEVWFVAYLHVSVWTFVALAAAELHRAASTWALVLLTPALAVAACFAAASVVQHRALREAGDWTWGNYTAFVDCIDRRLMELEKQRGSPRPFRVWGPTFPDVLVELSNRHPQWELTRTNDFAQRTDLALQHGREVDAVVVTETLRREPEAFEGATADPAAPPIESVWMTWRSYYLNRLYREAGWKPARALCLRGRWHAFLFMEKPLPAAKEPLPKPSKSPRATRPTHGLRGERPFSKS